MTNADGTEPHWGVLNTFKLMPHVWDDVTHIATALRALNASVSRPCCWAAGTGEFIKQMAIQDLEFGIDGDTGVLSWWDEDGNRWHPASGRNSDDVEYYMAGYHPMDFPAGSVVPIDDVLLAVAEYQHTRKRPTCVQWSQVPESA